MLDSAGVSQAAYALLKVVSLVHLLQEMREIQRETSGEIMAEALEVCTS